MLLVAIKPMQDGQPFCAVNYDPLLTNSTSVWIERMSNSSMNTTIPVVSFEGGR